jgi:hypothetical protein
MRAYVLMDKQGNFFGPGGWVEDIREARPFRAEHILKLLKAFPKSKASAIEVNIAYEPENLTGSPFFESFDRVAA